MKWDVLRAGKKTGWQVTAGTHETALELARRSIPALEEAAGADQPLREQDILVEPAAEPGKSADSRYYSQSGPILTEDQL